MFRTPLTGWCNVVYSYTVMPHNGVPAADTRLSVSLPADLATQLATYAKLHERTMASVIRLGLRRLFQEEGENHA